MHHEIQSPAAQAAQEEEDKSLVLSCKASIMQAISFANCSHMCRWLCTLDCSIDCMPANYLGATHPGGVMFLPHSSNFTNMHSASKSVGYSDSKSVGYSEI